MPSKLTQSTATQTYGSTTRTTRRRYCSSEWTYKPGTKIPDLTVQNRHSYVNNVQTSWFTTDPPGMINGIYPGGVPVTVQPFMAPDEDSSMTSLEQVALAKYLGKLRKGRASLGVTFGSWGQSSSMITTRLRQAHKELGRVYAKLNTREGARRLRTDARKFEREPLAGLILEGEFGWRPLVGDIQAALGVIAGKSIPPAFVVGRHKEVSSRYFQSGKIEKLNPNVGLVMESFTSQKMCTVASTAYVSNPNLFLLNHLGLLNPLEVAWDLIPWSFVVGMFVNVGSMLKSLTDEVGLTLANKSVTKVCKTNYTNLTKRYNYDPYSDPFDGSAKSLRSGGMSMKSVYRGRTVGSIPTLRWQVQVPELNKEQMVIAASLVVQRFTKINQLISVYHPFLKK